VNAAFVGDPQDVRTWPRLDPFAPHSRSITQWADQEGIAEPTALLMNQLGRLFHPKSLHAQAEPLYHRALAITEASLGPDHPTVGINLNNLAGLLQATNRLAEAEPFYRRALAIAEKTFGPDHPRVATGLNNLALLLQDTNRLSEAELLMCRHLAIFIRFGRKTGHPHPHHEAALRNYSNLLAAMGKSEADIKAALAALTGGDGRRDPH
jgi:tetratricopeptide (TPR) repeat protein